MQYVSDQLFLTKRSGHYQFKSLCHNSLKRHVTKVVCERVLGCSGCRQETVSASLEINIFVTFVSFCAVLPLHVALVGTASAPIILNLEQTTSIMLFQPNDALDCRPSQRSHATGDRTPRFISRQLSMILFKSLSTRSLSSELVSVPLKKRVRFAKGPVNDSVLEEVFHYDAVPSEMYAECYYSRKEKNYLWCQQLQLAQERLQTTPALVDSIYCLHGFDPQRKLQSDQEEDEATVTHAPQPLSTGSSITPETAKRLLAESELRGLEPLLTTLFAKHRQWAIDKLLDLQEVCRDEQRPLAHKEWCLQTWSIRASVATCMYSQAIASGDAQVAWLENDFA